MMIVHAPGDSQQEHSQDVRPLFVLGIHRSGTTWLANMLAGHSQIRAVEDEVHQGVHESIFFSHFARAFGDLSDDANFERFADAFVMSDYYLITELEPAWLYDRRPRSYSECFDAVMVEFARRTGGAEYWLEKSPDHTPFAGDLARDYPQARFVCITRSTLDVVRSRFWMRRRERPPLSQRLRLIFRFTTACVYHQRSLKRFAREQGSRAIYLTYESLKESTKPELRKILEFVGLPFEPEMTEPRYAPNTSFRSGRPKPIWTSFDRFATFVFSSALHCIPLSVLRRLFVSRRSKRDVEWPDWCWKRRDAGLV